MAMLNATLVPRWRPAAAVHSWWRHEQVSIAAAVATALHHSAQRGGGVARRPTGTEDSGNRWTRLGDLKDPQRSCWTQSWRTRLRESRWRPRRCWRPQRLRASTPPLSASSRLLRWRPEGGRRKSRRMRRSGRSWTCSCASHLSSSLLTNVPWSKGQVLSRTGKHGPLPARQGEERKSSPRLLLVLFIAKVGDVPVLFSDKFQQSFLFSLFSSPSATCGHSCCAAETVPTVPPSPSWCSSGWSPRFLLLSQAKIFGILAGMDQEDSYSGMCSWYFW